MYIATTVLHVSRGIVMVSARVRAIGVKVGWRSHNGTQNKVEDTSMFYTLKDWRKVLIL